MKKSFQKNNHILWAYAILIILVSIPILFKPKFLPYAMPFLAILMPIFTFLNNKGNALAEKIDGVKPVWKFLSVDSEIEYFSLDRSKSVVDNVRYYSLIVDDHDNIQSINKLDSSVVSSIKEKSSLNSNGELRDFYFSDNAIAESEKFYKLRVSPFFSKTNKKSKQLKKPIFISETKVFKKLNIIKATTIYGDDTYFFEGDGLSGGLTKINGKYKPYSGNWKHKDIKRAKKYLKNLQDKKDKRETNINDVLLKQLDIKDRQIFKLQKSLDQQQLQLSAVTENRELKEKVESLNKLIESSSSTQKRQATKKKDNLPNNDNPSHIKDKKDRMKKLKKATPEADSYITKTTTIKQPKNE